VQFRVPRAGARYTTARSQIRATPRSGILRSEFPASLVVPRRRASFGSGLRSAGVSFAAALSSALSGVECALSVGRSRSPSQRPRPVVAHSTKAPLPRTTHGHGGLAGLQSRFVAGRLPIQNLASARPRYRRSVCFANSLRSRSLTLGRILDGSPSERLAGNTSTTTSTTTNSPVPCPVVTPLPDCPMPIRTHGRGQGARRSGSLA